LLCHRAIARQQKRQQIQAVHVFLEYSTEIASHRILGGFLIRDLISAEHFSSYHGPSWGTPASARQLFQYVFVEHAFARKLRAVSHQLEQRALAIRADVRHVCQINE
jgi:hypothetical protein